VAEVAGFAERFEREHGCTESEWVGWLGAAAHGHRLARGAAGTARIDIGGGALHLVWQVLPMRRIALIELPRLQVRYAFVGVPPDARERFMRRFDLEIQRGGG
jgi:hypothetical protein